MPVDLFFVVGLSTGIIGFAFWRGSRPELLGGLILALNICFDLAVRTWAGRPDFSDFNTSRFVIDLVELGLLLLLALNANRVWPIFSAAAQLVAVAGSLAVMGTRGGMQLAYWAVTQMPLFAQLAALALGTFLHMRREAAVGPYRDWRLAFPSRR